MITADDIFQALKGRPSAYTVPATQLPAATYRWTREALKPLGVEPTDRDLETAFWSDRIRDLWDESAYLFARHEARVARRAKQPKRPARVRPRGATSGIRKKRK